MNQLAAPPCHWTKCSRFGKPMDLINEGDTFWCFACGCGCVRAISKPSTRAASHRAAYERDIEKIRELQRLRDSRPEYSLPSMRR